ncbi:hypothetical protein CEXT_323211 [Caerostris extrusa]|uniref:Uncharacterized protein n=1 Tax=Caerostris extrusa TaxID=172846 RepID=A0AAV4N4X9_CAEEX|nr:hypothetical protein CEXT_323211 [Caerostris extrusa]
MSRSPNIPLSTIYIPKRAQAVTGSVAIILPSEESHRKKEALPINIRLHFVGVRFFHLLSREQRVGGEGGDPSLQTDLDPGPRAREREPFRPRRMPTAPGVRERETKLYLGLERMEKKKG